MKLMYCIAGTCHSGGMERVLANKANYLVDKGYDITIVTTDQAGMLPFFELDSRIRSIDLNVKYEENNGKSFLNKLLYFPYKQYIHRKRLEKVLKDEKPDIVISMFCNDVSFITKIKDDSRKILEAHFSKFKRLQYGRRGLWKLADLWFSKRDESLVRKFDRFVLLTDEDKCYWGNPDNSIVIPNARSFSPCLRADLDSKVVLAIGRYTHQKGFERLIESWNIIYKDFKDWKLLLVGEGNQRKILEDLIDKYNLGSYVFLIKPDNDVEKFYLNSSVFALTSRYEGLPMVLLEAQAYGLPVVSFNCKCGPSDIIENGKTGFLVSEGDIVSFAEKLKKLMMDSKLRYEMGELAISNSENYSMDIIMDKWIKLFNSLA